MITINIYTAYYAPWDEGSDERERIDEHSDTITFHNARDCAEWLDAHSLNAPSVSPGPYNRNTWLYETAPIEDSYTGVMEEVSAALTADEYNDARVWAAIVASVSRRWTGYAGPYYVESRNVFGVRL